MSHEPGLTPANPNPAAHRRSLAILDVGTCEPLKAAVHGVALSLATLMAAYNAAAWLRRRQSHLAINAVIYFAAMYWEQKRVADHLVPCLPATLTLVPSPIRTSDEPDDPVGDQSKAA